MTFYLKLLYAFICNLLEYKLWSESFKFPHVFRCSSRLSLSLSIYIYIYICVCVCVYKITYILGCCLAVETKFHTLFVLLALLTPSHLILLLVTVLDKVLRHADDQSVTHNKLNRCAVKFCGCLTLRTAFSLLLFHAHVPHNKLAQRTHVSHAVRDNFILSPPPPFFEPGLRLAWPFL
jgi:hypothetical protein